MTAFKITDDLAIPECWTLTSLMEVSTIKTGKRDANHATKNGKYRFYTCAFDFLKCDTKSFDGECLILPGNGANVGEVFFYNGEFEAYQRTYVIEKIQLFPKYLFYHLKSNWKSLNSDKQYGSATNYIRIGNFKDYLVKLPPLQEQHRIVAKIEELFSHLDSGIDSLKKAQAQLKIYRQAVLKYAFEGKLTEEWRKQHQPEPAEKLLEQIRLERERHHQQQLKDWKAACEQAKAEGKKKPTKPRKQEFYDSFDINEANILPFGWKWEKIGNICQSIVPNRDKPKSFTGDIPWLTIPDIDLDKISVEFNKINKHLSEKEIEIFNARLIPVNSVIMSCVGTFGIICTNSQKCVINQQLHAFITHRFIHPKYLAYSLKYQKKYMDKNSTSTTIFYLNKTKCNSTPIPICSIMEQKAIVQEIESRLSICDKLEQDIETNLQKAEALRQSILKKAFEGKLVPQDPNDEPAEKLLERIQLEKAELEAKAKAAKTQKRKTKSKPKRSKKKTA